MGPFHKQPELRSADRPLWSASSAKTPVKLPPHLLEGKDKKETLHCGTSTLSFIINPIYIKHIIEPTVQV